MFGTILVVFNILWYNPIKINQCLKAPQKTAMFDMFNKTPLSDAVMLVLFISLLFIN